MSGNNNNNSNNMLGGGGNGAAPQQIALSIMTPNQYNNNREAAGGSMGEWSQKMVSLGCIAGLSLLLIGAALGVAVGALWYVYKADPEVTCIGMFAGITFSYITWLRVLGWTFVGGISAEMILLMVHGISGTVLTSKIATFFGLIFFGFQAAWYAVGAILYWKTVTTNCEGGSQLQMFSLALFIIQSTVVTCLFCGRKAAQYAAH